MAGPFGGDPLDYGTHWLAFNGSGGTTIGADVKLGKQNDLSIDHHDYEGATIVTLSDSETAVFAALNGGGNPNNPLDKGQGGVGVFGQSIAGGIDEDYPPPAPPPLTKGIGVAGHCNTGCGVYGQSLYGIGVVGRADEEGWGLYATTLSTTFQNAGVLGQSENAPGVRGHAGDLVVLENPTDAFPNPPFPPGGVFSSGELAQTDKDSDVFSRSAFAQLRLVPCKPGHGIAFPLEGSVGDFFVTYEGDAEFASLYLCLQLALDGVAMWSKVAISGNPIRGGKTIGS
jgi:hypothetical protein